MHRAVAALGWTEEHVRGVVEVGPAEHVEPQCLLHRKSGEEHEVQRQEEIAEALGTAPVMVIPPTLKQFVLMFTRFPLLRIFFALDLMNQRPK